MEAFAAKYPRLESSKFEPPIPAPEKDINTDPEGSLAAAFAIKQKGKRFCLFVSRVEITLISDKLLIDPSVPKKLITATGELPKL
jgi:hypothetical protein